MPTKNIIQQIQGGAILRRQTTPDDASVICQAYQNQAFLRLFAAHRKVPQSETELRQNLHKRNQIAPEALHYVEWLIIHKRHGAIGIAALNDYAQNQPHAEYLIGLFEAQNCHFGYGITATLLVLELAFNYLNLNKIYSLVYDYNPIAGQI
jgi:ribosomal-protein-alanine N-acetyltransferase